MGNGDLTSYFIKVLEKGFKPFFPETFILFRDSLFEYMMSDPKDATEFEKNHRTDIVAFREVREMLRLETWEWGKRVITSQYLTERISEKLMSIAVLLVPGIDLDFLTVLSSERYESASADNLSIVLLPSLSSINAISGSIKFHNHNNWEFDIPNAHAIRKQLNTGGEMLLAAAYNHGSYQTVGLVPPSCLRDYYSVVIAGHAHWKLCYPSKSSIQCLIQHKNGMLRFPTLNILPEIKAHVHTAFSSIGKRQVDIITKIIARTIRQAKKGTVLVFSDPKTIASETERLVKKHVRGVCFHYRTSPNLTRASDGVIKSFSSVDGAILVDTNGFCHSFGVILDGKVSDEEIGTSARGAKFNCTQTYIHSLLKDSKEALGVVISEDGMIDLLLQAERGGEMLAPKNIC